jgi:capsule polysaccharide export protein KpsE/RkpR
MADLSTSSAHRERVFLEERLKVAKQELDDATNALAQFSSKNNTIDIQTEGKAMLDAAASLAGELIAAQSQLEGLRQIYTDNNPRVRSLNARVAELREQLDKLGGTQESAATSTDPPSGIASSIPFPSIRNLPLLGAKYADYYRDAKIQETVFELLTEQYELAKVQEAKETPSVKVLDPGRSPEKKSYPPRLMIVLLGTLLALAVTGAWVLATKYWDELHSSDPRKVLAEEVVATLKANAPWSSRNGDAPHSTTQRIWNRLNRAHRSENSPTGK